MRKQITLILFSLILSVCSLNANATNVTIRFKAPASWENVFVYTYGGIASPTWPGDDITGTKDTDGFYSFSYDDTVGGINIMFNNNAAEKTDIYRTQGNACYEPVTLTGELWSVTEVDCPGAATGNTTVRFKVPANWDRVFVYTYSPSLIADFWGKELISVDANGFCSFNFDLTTASINVMFHNGLNEGQGQEKTDIFIEKTGNSCFEPGTLEGVNLSVVEVECPGEEPQGNTSVRFKAPANWNKVFVYTYNPTLIADFWGKELTSKDTYGYYTFTFDLTTESINIMFHNGLNEGEGQEKTDIFVTKSACFDPGTLEGVNLSVVEVDCPGGTWVENESMGNSFTIYPNPTNGIVYLNSVDQIQKVILFNALGQQLQVINQVTNNVDLGHYNSGIYYLSIQTIDGQQVTRKIIRQ